MFKIGQHVVCVDDKWEQPIRPSISSPQLGQVYTVRGWNEHMEGMAILLEEILNPKNATDFVFQEVYLEVHWGVYHFKALSDVEIHEIIRPLGDIPSVL